VVEQRTGPTAQPTARPGTRKRPTGKPTPAGAAVPAKGPVKVARKARTAKAGGTGPVPAAKPVITNPKAVKQVRKKARKISTDKTGLNSKGQKPAPAAPTPVPDTASGDGTGTALPEIDATQERTDEPKIFEQGID
jgi:hypothetical protein